MNRFRTGGFPQSGVVCSVGGTVRRSAVETFGVFGVGAFVGRAERLAAGGILAGLYARGGEPLSGLLCDDGRATVELPQFIGGVEDVPVGGGPSGGFHADLGEQTAPSACEVPGQRCGLLCGGFDHAVCEPRLDGLPG